MTSHKRGRVGIVSGALAVGFALFAWMREPQVSPKHFALKPVPYTISHETTWITEPLRPDGAVDYVAALNARLGEGVTPENNAAVLLMEVIGAEEIEPGIREEFYRQLGVPLPENAKGDFESYRDFVDRYLESVESPDEELRERLLDHYYEAWERPWTPTEFPILAQWLDANQQSIERIVAATEWPRLYFPYVIANEEEWFYPSRSSMTSELRELEKMICIHAMHAIGQGQLESAHRDVMACNRLATWGCDSSTVYYQMGIANVRYERRIALALAASPFSTPEQLRNLRRDLASRPLPVGAAMAYDLSERFTVLDWARRFKTVTEAVKVGKAFDMPQTQIWKRFGEMGLDVGLVLTIVNSRFSQMVEALKQPDYLSRKAALEQFVEELQAFRKKSLDSNEVANLILGRRPAQEVVSTEFAHEFAWYLLYGSPNVTETENLMLRQITLLGLALAEYQRDHGNYPGTLDALVPKYLDAIPLDAFTLKPLIYKPRDDGYLLYSLGPDGEDDSGAEFSPDGELDDVSIRMPIEPEM